MICQEIANKIKKEVHIKEKPMQPVLCAIIAASAYTLNKKTRDQYGAYYEYALKDKHLIALKMCSTQDEAR